MSIMNESILFRFLMTWTNELAHANFDPETLVLAIATGMEETVESSPGLEGLTLPMPVGHQIRD